MVQYKIPPKPSLVRFDEASLPGKGPVTPPGGGKAIKGWSDANFSYRPAYQHQKALVTFVGCYRYSCQYPWHLLSKPKKAGNALWQVAQLGRQVPAAIDINGVRKTPGASNISWSQGRLEVAGDVE
jgi:hypothetical protein